jgi:hypothetical protein
MVKPGRLISTNLLSTEPFLWLHDGSLEGVLKSDRQMQNTLQREEGQWSVTSAHRSWKVEFQPKRMIPVARAAV